MKSPAISAWRRDLPDSRDIPRAGFPPTYSPQRAVNDIFSHEKFLLVREYFSGAQTPYADESTAPPSTSPCSRT